MALATAAVVGDKEASRRHNCSDRTLRDWRKRCETDDELAAACLRARAKLEAGWAKELPAALMRAIAFLSRSFEDGDPSDPDMTNAVCKALMVISDVQQAQRILDVRLSQEDRRSRAQPLAVAPTKAA